MHPRVRRAIRSFANVVKQLNAMVDLKYPDPRVEYHGKEYLDEMEDLLLQQLITATTDRLEREDLLIACEMDYLLVRLEHKANEWENP